MIDTHAHLGDDAAEVLARARAAGVTRVIDVATSLAGARRSLARAEATDDVHCVPRHPPARGRELRPRCARRAAASCSRTRARSRSARPASTTSATTRRRRRSRSCSTRQLALASDTGKPVVIHTRAADDDTRARLLGARRPGDPPLFLLTAVARRGARTRVVGVIRGQRHLQERLRPPRGRPAGAAGASARRDRQPVSRAAGGARQARTSPRTSCTRSPALADVRGVDQAELEAQIDRNADEVFAL